MKISHHQRIFRDIAESRCQLLRRNRVNECFAVKTIKENLAFIRIEYCKPFIGIIDQTREMERYIGKESYLHKETRYNGPGGFDLTFMPEEADDVYHWFLDSIDTDKRPPIGLFDSKERVRGLPAYLWTLKALKKKEDIEYRRNQRRGLH